MLGKQSIIIIIFRDELTIDYRWDESELAIPENVYCLCEKEKCRLYLMKTMHKNSESS